MIKRYELQLSRREMVRSLTGAAALIGLAAEAASSDESTLPGPRLLDTAPEAHWERLRGEQSLLPGTTSAFVNTGSLDVTARPVLQAGADYLYKAADLDISDLQLERYPRRGYETLAEAGV